MMNFEDKDKDTLVASLAFAYQIARRIGHIDTGGDWALRARDLLVELVGRQRAEVALRVADQLVDAITLQMGKKEIIRKLFGESGLAHAEEFIMTGEAVTAIDRSGGFIAAETKGMGEEAARLLTELLTVASKL
jgi:hypothetical protein